jgi:hypothetical protein
LYNMNIQEPSLESIDLDNLVLLGKQPFDKEGPNGVGNKGRGGIVHMVGDSILFKGWPSPEILHLTTDIEFDFDHLATLSEKTYISNSINILVNYETHYSELLRFTKLSNFTFFG